MSVKITGVAEAKRTFGKIEEFLASPKPMAGVVEDIKERILTNTAASHDYRGRNFKPYSTAYAKKKGTTRPDLCVSGRMLGALKARVVDPRHGQVFVASEQESGRASTAMLAQIHTTGTGKQPQREFLNITPNALQVIKKKRYDDPILELVRQMR